jgi:acyl-CoA reductase-like NAD-dependent aldehyde dehydrogenase
MAADRKVWRNQSPGDLSVEMPEVCASEAEPALAAAQAAAKSWARTPLGERIARLRDAQKHLATNRDSLAHGIALEVGKPITEAQGELGAVIAKIDLTVGDAEQHLAPQEEKSGPHPAMVRHIARGPAVVIAPFNFPLHLGNGAIVAYLLAGNPVIFKPSPLAAVVAAKYAELMASVLPRGVFNLVQGGGGVAQQLCRDPRVRSICFTGSVAVGRALAVELAGDLSKDVALELGGKNAAIVCADADLQLSAESAAQGACLTSGQRCNATSRVIVEQAVAAEFRERFLAALRQYEPGDPLRPETRFGPLVNQAAVDRYAKIISDQSAEWILPGKVEPEIAGKRGCYVRPALLRQRAEDAAHEEEAFVPIVSMYEAADLEEAVRIHNAPPYGMTASIFTRSRERFWQVADELCAGNLYANLPTTFSPSTLPFGGLGMSGNHHPGGRGFIRFATDEQAVQMAAGGFSEPD